MNKKSTFKECANNYLTHTENNSAITLIALVITIIVLLILAGVALNMIMGENGIFRKANTAKEKTIEAQAEEDVNLKILETEASNDGKFSYSKFMEILNNSGDTYIVTDETNKTLTAIPDDYDGKINVVNERYGVKVGVTKELQISAEGKINSPNDYTENLLYKTNYATMQNGVDGITISNGVTIHGQENYVNLNRGSTININSSNINKDNKMNGTSDKTIIAWFRCSPEANGNIVVAFPMFTNSNSQSCHMGVNGGIPYHGLAGLTIETKYNDNRWHMMTGVWRDGSNWEFYVDGNKVSEGTAGYSTIGSNPYTIGDTSYPYEGDVGECRAYSAKLTAEQINTIYNYGRQMYYSD